MSVLLSQCSASSPQPESLPIRFSGEERTVSPNSYGITGFPVNFDMTAPGSSLQLGQAAYLVTYGTSTTPAFARTTVNAAQDFTPQDFTAAGINVPGVPSTTTMYHCFPYHVDLLTESGRSPQLHPVNRKGQHANEIPAPFSSYACRMATGSSESFLLSYSDSALPDADPQGVSYFYNLPYSQALSSGQAVYWR